MYQYELLAEELKKKAEENLHLGILRLPTQEELCRQYQVSRVTVRRALEILEKEGIIKSRQGSGSVLTGLSPKNADNRIALLLPDPDEFLMPAFYGAVRNRAAQDGYTLSLYRTDGDLQKERDILEELSKEKNPPRGIMAMDICPIPSPNADLYRKLYSNGCHTLFLSGKDPACTSAGCLRTDMESAARDAVSRLVRMGHRNIAGMFDMTLRSGMESCAAFLSALRDEGLSIAGDRVFLPGRTDAKEIIKKGTSRSLHEFLSRVESACTAIVCETDLLAYSAALLLSRDGIRVPQHMSLVSLASSYLQGQSSLHVDTYDPKESPGNAAMDLLLSQMRGEAPEEHSIGLQYRPGNTVLRIL